MLHPVEEVTLSRQPPGRHVLTPNERVRAFIPELSTQRCRHIREVIVAKDAHQRTYMRKPTETCGESVPSTVPPGPSRRDEANGKSSADYAKPLQRIEVPEHPNVDPGFL